MGRHLGIGTLCCDSKELKFKKLNETLSTDQIVFETSENASRHSGSRCIEFFIRPNFQLSKLTLFTISKTK
ncbi:hypothetical protein Lepto1548_03550 [Leptospira interrogans serovar Bataviae]|nr:hypothetical protein Lepto1548_03550 [Leptospira interrogans serovar Bataviae]